MVPLCAASSPFGSILRAKPGNTSRSVVLSHDMRCIIRCALHFVALQPVPQELKAANMRYRAAMRAIGAIGGA
jgi:hypothetical protein